MYFKYTDDREKLLESYKTNKEFIDGVENEYGTPDDWELDDKILQQQAVNFYVWTNDPDVIEARKIADSGYRFEFRLPRRGVDTRKVTHYNGACIYLPSWENYDDEEALIQIAKSIKEQYYEDNPSEDEDKEE